MRKGFILLLTVTILSGLTFGCAGNSAKKETWIKCPKCGAFFSTREGAEEFNRMRGYPSR